MKQRIRINESQLRRIVSESVKAVLNEVTDFGNNIFGSAYLNNSLRDDETIPKYHSEEYIQLLDLKREAVYELLKGTPAANENYLNNRPDIIYLYGGLEDTKDDVAKLKSLYNEHGWNISAKEGTNFSGYNKYLQTIVTIFK